MLSDSARRLRTIAVIPAAVLAALLAGCGIVGFDVGQDIPEQTVKGSPNPLDGILPDFLASPIPITIDIRQETQKRSTGPATSAFLTSLTLVATPHAMPSGNFDFLSAVHVFVAPQQGSSPPSTEVARLDPVPRSQTQLNFEILPNIDLLPYVNAGAQISAQASGKQPVKDFTFDGHITLHVKL